MNNSAVHWSAGSGAATHQSACTGVHPTYTARFFPGPYLMFFKNLVVYRLPADWQLSAAELESRLARHTLQPCSPFEMLSKGWVAPSGTGRLVHTVNQQHLIALGANQKLLPSSIIRQEALTRAVTLAAEQGFPVGRRQMRDLKIRITEEPRARALTCSPSFLPAFPLRRGALYKYSGVDCGGSRKCL